SYGDWSSDVCSSDLEGPPGLQAHGPPLPALRHADRGAWPGRRQPHDLLVPRMSEVTRALKRVGHKGADLVAPGNTVASFQAALEAGVDMIEFDLLRLRDGRIVFAHDYEDAARREPLPLDEGIDHRAGASYADVEFDIDMKLLGYERDVVEAIASRDLDQRVLVSSHYLESL